MNQLSWPFLLFLVNIYFTFHCELSTLDPAHRRTIRSPDSERIQRWKLAFSGNLAPFHGKQPTVSCNWALKELCLKHISCRELWTLFRRNCLVDAQNNCLMINKYDCWQSFEGISWTGLGTCACPGNNSDCHWIRLQTNYNKCIYLLNHDTNWHAELNSPAKFYAINGYRNHFSELGIERWKQREYWDWQQKQQRSKEEEEMRRRRIEEEEKERKRKMKEEEERKIRAKEKERKNKAQEEWIDRIKAEDERMKGIKAEEERVKSIKAEGERMKKIKAEEERKKKAKTAEERKKKRKQEEEVITAARKKKQREDEEKRNEEKMKKNNVYYTTVDSNGEMEEIMGSGRGRPTATTKNNDKDDGGGGRWTPTTASTIQIQRQHSAGTTHGNRVMIRPTEAEQLETQAEEPPTSARTVATTKNGRGQSPEKRPPHLSPQKDDSNPRGELPQIIDKEPIPAGTCPEVLSICERDESACKWHLSELLIKCPNSTRFDPCQRSAQCSAALSRFVRFVPAQLAEAMLFCSPTNSRGDVQKMPLILVGFVYQNQSFTFTPNCLTPSSSSSLSARKKPKARWSCTQTAQMCRAEPSCNRRLIALRNGCPFVQSINKSTMPPSCSAKSLAKCRTALTSIRGSWLDEPCFCPSTRTIKKTVEECRKWQWIQWPGNPCIGEVQRDFNELFLAGQLNVELPTIMPPPIIKSANSTAQIPSSLWIRAKPPAANNIAGEKKAKMLVQMELGEEVSLLPTEIGRHGEEEEVPEKRKGKLADGEEQMMRNGTNGKSKGKWGIMTTPMGNNLQQRRRTSKTTTTTTMGTPFAEELIEEENAALDGQMDGKQQQKLQIEMEEKGDGNKKKGGGQLSYELAEPKKKEVGENWRNKLTNSEELETNNLTSKTTTTPKPSPADVAHFGEWEQQQMATTGRQPLPEFDFVTQKPPIEGDGCQTRNIDGEWVEHYPDSVFREFHDWAGQCSSWCECSPTNGTAKCHPLGCLSDVLCEARHTTVVFGQRLYLENRGACQCHDGRFVCDSSELRPQLGPGLYLSLGYSKAELDLIRQKVPKPVLERSGLISQSSSVVKDLATRLQFALERILPEGMQCRVALLENFPPEQVVLMQLQWFGVDPSVNNSRAKWHSGKMEKHCSAYVRELELIFLLEKAPRYQLLLSTIKQIRVIDLLDALPPNSAKMLRIGAINSLFFPFSLLFIITSTHTISPFLPFPFILPILVNFILLFRL